MEKINTVVVRNLLQVQEGKEIKRYSYAIEIDQSKKCYNCGSFEHMAYLSYN